MAQCINKTPKGRQCKLEAHPDNQPHKYVIRTEQKPLSALVPQGFTLKAERVPEGEKLRKATRAQNMVRDVHQKQADKDAVTNYGEWVRAGRKADFNDHPHARYVVPPRAVEAVLTILRRTVGSGGPAQIKGKVFRYRKGTHESGNMVIEWSISDPIVKPAVAK